MRQGKGLYGTFLLLRYLCRGHDGGPQGERFQDSGGAWNTSIGFTGYVHTPSAKFNDQVPTGLLVQAVEYGTEFRKPVHLLNKSVRAAESDIQAAMQKYIDDKVNEITN